MWSLYVLGLLAVVGGCVASSFGVFEALWDVWRGRGKL